MGRNTFLRKSRRRQPDGPSGPKSIPGGSNPAAPHECAAASIEIEGPRLPDETAPQRLMWRLAHQAETGGDIYASRRDQHVVGPQGEPAVTELASTFNAGLDERTSEAESTRAGFDVKKPELRDAGLVALHQEYRANDRTATLGDPAILAGVIERGDKLAEDLAGEALIGPVPAVLLMIEHGLAMNDPADVSRRQAPQTWLPGGLAVLKNGADVAHRRRQQLPAVRI